MEAALGAVVAGATNGAVYGIAALGIVLVFRVARIINLAQGEAITIGALGTWWLDTRWGWPRALAAVAAVAGAGAYFGTAARLTVLRGERAASRDGINAALVTLALALFTQGLLFAAFGRDLYGSPPLLSAAPFDVGVPVPAHTVIMLAATLGIGAVLAAVLRWTMAGRALVGCAESRLGAATVGVDVPRTIAMAFVAAGAFGALAGVILAPVTVFSYLTGFGLALRGLAAAALVGFRSAGAGLAAGLAVGVLEALVSTYISSGYQEPFVAAVLIAALVARPQLCAAGAPR